MYKKHFLIVILSLLFSLNIFCQEVLNNLNTSWTNVLPGVIISQPVVTSYGFCAATDARTISAFSNSGTLLWETSISKSKNIILSALPADFICLIDNSASLIKVLNPSGGEIWNKKINYSVTETPFSGRDGRVFIKGQNIIQCFGMNGVCKWSMETENQKKMPLQELPDGSLIVFLTEQNGKTRGLRISPFGEQMEEILFAGQVLKAYSCSQGVILSFADGSSGLFTVINDLSQNKWVLPKKNKDSIYAVSQDKKNIIFLELYSSSIILNQVNMEDGTIFHSVKIDGMSGDSIQNVSYNQDGVFICNKKSAVLYNKDGNELWSASVPNVKGKEIWNYSIFTKANYLIFCYKDWTINAYRILQNNSKSVKNEKTFTEEYSDFINISDNQFSVLYTYEFENKLTDPQIAAELKNGYYANKEKQWLSQVLSICLMYSNELSTSDFGTRKEHSIFEQDSTGFEQILNQLMLLGTIESQNCAASILSKTTNKSYLKIFFNGIKENGYDPDGTLLKALEIKAGKIDVKDRTLITSLCDAVYSICVFMGRPAYNSKGKDILKNFLYPSYDSKVRDYSRETLKKIMALDL